jgi:hypothetical protein
MEVIDQVVEKLDEHRGTGSSQVLANALASACNSDYGVSLLDASVRLDAQNKQLFNRLANIRQEPDYSNADQSEALQWLRKNKFIK